MALCSEFVLSVALCSEFLLSVALCSEFLLSVALYSEFLCAGMSGLWLLNGDIDRGHRAAIWYERKLEPLVTRTPKENWKIHSGWLQRYVIY